MRAYATDVFEPRRNTAKEHFACQGPVSRESQNFSGAIPGDIILLVSSKRGRLEAPNFAVIFIVPFITTYEKTSFTEQAGRGITKGF